jgi:Na+-translocating ferredoxin:NAD+ oxidoreductase RnfC subunit
MSRVMTFFRGGIEVDSFRNLMGVRPLRPLFIPSLAVIPLVQYPDAKAEWIVEAGALVAEDQILGRGLGE